MMSPEPVVPARRVEVLDDDGNIRALLGPIERGPGSASAFGLSLRSSEGEKRVVLVLDDHGPTLVFVQNGNIAIHVGVDDPDVPDDHVGAYVTIADARGEPSLLLRVGAGGSLQIETP